MGKLTLWHRGDLNRALVAIGLAFLVLATIADAQTGAIFGGTLTPETVTLQLAIFALDAATLGIMLRAIATPADAAVVSSGFVFASMVATLAWMPRGLGTFEKTCVAMLHVHGVAIEAALAATLLARGFTFWPVMAPGLTIAWREMMRGTESAGRDPERRRRDRIRYFSARLLGHAPAGSA